MPLTHKQHCPSAGPHEGVPQLLTLLRCRPLIHKNCCASAGPQESEASAQQDSSEDKDEEEDGAHVERPPYHTGAHGPDSADDDEDEDEDDENEDDDDEDDDEHLYMVEPEDFDEEQELCWCPVSGFLLHSACRLYNAIMLLTCMMA